MAITVKERERITYVFLFIVLLTAIAAVAANLGIFGLDPDSNFAKTTLVSVLVEIVAVMIIILKASSLEETKLSAVIEFPEGTDPFKIDWDYNACFYEVRDMQANVKSAEKLNVALGLAGWECKFPLPKSLDDSIRLTLTDREGGSWEVRPFYPLSTTVPIVRR